MDLIYSTQAQKPLGVITPADVSINYNKARPKVKMAATTRSVNTSQELAPIGLIHHQVVSPLTVKDRAEWNSNIYLLQKKKKRKKYKPIDTYLKIPFPVHNIINFVGLHSRGFTSRENIDIFKHYLRMYLKNMFVINQIKREKQDEQTLYRNPGDRRGNALISQKEANKINLFYSNLAAHADDESDATEIDDKLQSVPLKQYVLEESLENLRLCKQIIHLYEERKNPIEILANKSKVDQERDLKQSLTSKIFIQLDQNLIIQKPQHLFNLEEVFITRIMEAICKQGLGSISYLDYMTFKSIIDERLMGLQNLKMDGSVLQKLLQVKTNMTKKLEGDYKEKDKLFQSDNQGRDEQNHNTLSQNQELFTNEKNLGMRPFSPSPHTTLTTHPRNKDSQWSNSLRNADSHQDEIFQAAKALDLEGQLMDLLKLEKSDENQDKIQSFVENMLLQYRQKSEMHITNELEEQASIQASIQDLYQSLMNDEYFSNQNNNSQKLLDDEKISNKNGSSRMNNISNSESISRKVQSYKNTISMDQSEEIKKDESNFSTPKLQPAPHSMQQMKKSDFEQSSQQHQQTGGLGLSAQRISIRRHRVEENDMQLNFLKDLLENHKKANKQLFSKIADGETIEDDQRQPQSNEQKKEDELVHQYFRAERMLQHRFKKSNENGGQFEMESPEEQAQRRRQGKAKLITKVNKYNADEDTSNMQSNEMMSSQFIGESDRSMAQIKGFVANSTPNTPIKPDRRQSRKSTVKSSKQFIVSQQKISTIPSKKDISSAMDISMNEAIEKLSYNHNDNSRQEISGDHSSQNRQEEIPPQRKSDKKSSMKKSTNLMKKTNPLQKIVEESTDKINLNYQQPNRSIEQRSQNQSIYESEEDLSNARLNSSSKDKVNPREKTREKTQERTREVNRERDPLEQIQGSQIIQPGNFSTRTSVLRQPGQQFKQNDMQKRMTKLSPPKVVVQGLDTSITDGKSAHPSAEKSQHKSRFTQRASKIQPNIRVIQSNNQNQSSEVQATSDSESEEEVSEDDKRKGGQFNKKNLESHTNALEPPQGSKKKKKTIIRKKDEESSLEVSQEHIQQQKRRQTKRKTQQMVHDSDSSQQLDESTTRKRQNSKQRKKKPEKVGLVKGGSRKSLIGTQAVQEMVLQKQQKQLSSLKDELKKFMSQQWNMVDMKDHIDDVISQLEQSGTLDDETKYNIFLYRQRQKALNQIQNQDPFEQIFSGPDVIEGVRTIFKQKLKFVDHDDKALKFMNSLGLAKESEQISQTMVFDINMYPQSQWVKQDFNQRRECFNEDTEKLKLLRQITPTLKQHGLEVKAKYDGENELELYRKISLPDPIQKDTKNKKKYASRIPDQSDVRLISRLKLLYHEDPQRFESFRGLRIESDEDYVFLKRRFPNIMELQKKNPFSNSVLRIADQVFARSQCVSQYKQQN